MRVIKIIENRFSKTLCAILNIPALTLYHLILLGCYKDRYETLLHETTHFYAFRTNKWYIFKHIWKLLRKEK